MTIESTTDRASHRRPRPDNVEVRATEANSGWARLRSGTRIAAVAAFVLAISPPPQASAAADKEFTAPFSKAGTYEQKDDCRPVYRTWGDCDATGAANDATGEIRATATLRRGVQHTGGVLRAVASASVGDTYRLTRPARAIQLEAVVEARAVKASWWQSDPLNSTAPGYEGWNRSSAHVRTSILPASFCSICRHEQASEGVEVSEPNLSAGPLAGTYRLAAKLAAAPREMLAPGDYYVGIHVQADTTSLASPVGALLSTVAKDTGSFDADSSVRLVKLVASAA